MEDKKIILKALDWFTNILLPKSDVTILKILIALEGEGVIQIKTSELMAQSGYTRQGVNLSLSNLRDQGYITKELYAGGPNVTTNIITLDYKKIVEILPHYKAYERYLRQDFNEEKKLLLKSIDLTNKLRERARLVLKTLVCLEFNSVVLINTRTLKSLVNFSCTQNVYDNLKLLEKHSLIDIRNDKCLEVNIYEITKFLMAPIERR